MLYRRNVSRLVSLSGVDAPAKKLETCPPLRVASDNTVNTVPFEATFCKAAGNMFKTIEWQLSIDIAVNLTQFHKIASNYFTVVSHIGCRS